MLFPRGHPSRYGPGLSLVNFGDCTKTGVSIGYVHKPEVLKKIRIRKTFIFKIRRRRLKFKGHIIKKEVLEN